MATEQIDTRGLSRNDKRILDQFEKRNSTEKYSVGDLEFSKKSIDDLLRIPAENIGTLKPHIKDIVDIATKISGGYFKDADALALSLLNYTNKYEDDVGLSVSLDKICSDDCLGIEDPAHLSEVVNFYKNPKELEGYKSWELTSDDEFPDQPFFLNQDGVRFFQHPKRFDVGGNILKISEGWRVVDSKDDGFLNDQTIFLNTTSGLYFIPKEKLYYDPKNNKTFSKIEDADKPAKANIPGTSESQERALEMQDDSAAKPAELRKEDEKSVKEYAPGEPNLSNEELSKLTYLLDSLKDVVGSKIEISKGEWSLLQRLSYVAGRQYADNENIRKVGVKFDEENGLEETNRIAESKNSTIFVNPEYVDYMQELFTALNTLNSTKSPVEDIPVKEVLKTKLTSQEYTVTGGPFTKNESFSPAGDLIYGSYLNFINKKAVEAAAAVAAEAAKSKEEIVQALPAIQAVGRSTMKQALERLGVLGIPPEGVVNEAKALGALSYGKPVEKKNWRDKLRNFFNPAIKPVSGFIENMRDKFGDRTWRRKTIEVAGSASKVAVASLILLLLLEPNKKEEVATEPIKITKPDLPKTVTEDITITDEMKAACRKGDNSYMIKCIRSVVGRQNEKLRTELTKIIFDAAQKRAVSEGSDWLKLSRKEKDAYVDAVLGGDKNSPSGQIAKELKLDTVPYTFTGMDDLKKQGIKVAMPETPKSHVPIEMVIERVRNLAK